MKIWETDGYRKTLRDAIKEFSETYFSEPRFYKILNDGQFKLIDGIGMYKACIEGKMIRVDKI